MINLLILVALIVIGSYAVGSARRLLKDQPIACDSAADLARMLETSELNGREASEVKRRIGQIVLR